MSRAFPRARELHSRSALMRANEPLVHGEPARTSLQRSMDIEDTTSFISEIVADRFLRLVNSAGLCRWYDLATGDSVAVDISSLPGDLEEEERLERAIACGCDRIIDGGRLGVAHWFVARVEGLDALCPPTPRCCEHVAAICDEAERSQAKGVCVVPLPVEGFNQRTVVYVLARILRGRGYIVINAAWLRSPTLLSELSGRHVCVIDDRRTDEAVRWTRTLGASSRRTHLVFALTDDGPNRAPPRDVARRGPRASRAPIDTWRSDAAAARARACLYRCDFEGAGTVLGAAVAEARMRGRPTGPEIDTVRAELCLWEGRLDDARPLVTGAAKSDRALIVRGLLAWRGGDDRRVAATAAALLARAEETAMRLWTETMGLLAGSLRGDERRVVTAARQIVALGRERWGASDRVAFLAAAAGAIACGQAAWAWRLLGPPRRWRGATPLEALTLAWIRTVDRQPQRQVVLERLERAGAFGLREWTTRSHTMQLVQALPAMLQAMHDAEDDRAALAAAGEWLRRECGAEAVAFFTVDQPTRISASAWTTGDTTALFAVVNRPLTEGGHRGPGDLLFVVASVRYASTTVAWAIAKGRVERQARIDEATRMVAAVSGAACRARLDALRTADRGHAAMPEILGRSPGIVALREAVVRAAATPFSVLIEGESDTGKELVARAIHRLGARRDRRFTAVNCAAITDELVEAELFGHARGAFTGAVGLRTGLFEDAHGGTLFLDEVGELSPRAQAKILRALQEREVRRVGENSARPIDVRVIAATNRPLSDLAARAGFREDLLFRLAVIRIALPPLRDRLEDIPVLAESCWRTLTAEARKRAVLGADALAALCRHTWPGNVREFQNVVAALVVAAPARGRVGARHVHHVLTAGATTGREEVVVPLHQMRMTYERRAIAGALVQYQGRRAAAARALGLSRQGLTKAIRRLGLDRPRDIAGVA